MSTVTPSQCVILCHAGIACAGLHECAVALWVMCMMYCALLFDVTTLSVVILSCIQASHYSDCAVIINRIASHSREQHDTRVVHSGIQTRDWMSVRTCHMCEQFHLISVPHVNIIVVFADALQSSRSSFQRHPKCTRQRSLSSLCVYVYVHTCIYIYMYIHTHMCIYIYI